MAGFAANASFSNIFSTDQIVLNNESVINNKSKNAAVTGIGSLGGGEYSVYLGGLAGFSLNLSISNVDVSVSAQNDASDTTVALGDLIGALFEHEENLNVTNWSDNGLKNYIQNNILEKNSSLVYESMYDLASKTPAEFASEYFSKANGKSILESAVENWFKTCTRSDIVELKKKYKTLDALRKARPDLVPSKFTIL